jgi:dolichyl-phosphate beta-glucosyltransferase
MQITVIIPMYNEKSIIAETAKTLSSYMEANFESYEILFSDDGSKDGCGDIVRELSLPNIRVTGYAENHGKGCAVRTAMLEAQGDLVMFTDADLAYGVEVIGRAYDLWEKQGRPQLLLGSRNQGKNGYEGYTFLRRVMSKVYIKILCLFGGFRLSDSQCGCKAYANAAAKEIFSRCQVNGFAFDFETILWADRLGYRIEEMPVRIINHRESKIHVLRDTVRMLRDLVRMRRRIKREARKMR